MSNWLLGSSGARRVDRVELESLEMGAFPLRDGGIPLTIWTHMLNWLLGSSDLGRERDKKRENELLYSTNWFRFEIGMLPIGWLSESRDRLGAKLIDL